MHSTRVRWYALVATRFELTTPLLAWVRRHVRDEHPVDLGDLCAAFHERGFRFILIGRQAVRFYGAAVSTFDYDFWVDPAMRMDVLNYFDTEVGAEVFVPPIGTSQAIIRDELDKIDLLFLSRIVNQEGEVLRFEDVLNRAVHRGDGLRRGTIPIPCLDDLIALKKCRLPHARDEEDLRFLAVRKALMPAP